MKIDHGVSEIFCVAIKTDSVLRKNFYFSKKKVGFGNMEKRPVERGSSPRDMKKARRSIMKQERD